MLQYQVDIDPNRLRSYAVPLSTVVRAVMASNSNVGGNVVSANGSWSIVRGLGLIQNLDDIRQIVVASYNGTPVYVKDVGTVQIGSAFRTAALVKNTAEAVGGVVVARTGENTKQVIDRVKQKMLELQPGLPPGVRIVPFYDRSELIEATVDTLRHALIEEIVLVTLAHIVFLMHFRRILVVTLPLPQPVAAIRKTAKGQGLMTRSMRSALVRKASRRSLPPRRRRSTRVRGPRGSGS